MDFNSLRHFAESYAQRFIEEKGYNSASVLSIRLSPTLDGNVTMTFDLSDDFQENLNCDNRVKHGSWIELSGTDETEIEERFAAWPTRRRRELEVMAGLSTSAQAAREFLIDARAREFAEDLFSKREALLEDLRTERGGVPF